MNGDRATISRDDVYDQRLRDLVFPREWAYPRPTGRYHLLVIGGGTAGLVTAAAAAGLGARVALVEKQALGGDCLNTGCVPSKALLRAAKAAHELRCASAFGIVTNEPIVDFPAVMQRMRRVRSEMARHDSAERFRDLGVDVFPGMARFINSSTVDVDGRRLRFRRACIATGANASVPPIPGLEQAGYLTHATLFDIEQRPRRLAVIGGGPIGVEMAQCFARLGSEVTLFEALPRILMHDDPAAAQAVHRALESDGVAIRTSCTIGRVEKLDAIRVIHSVLPDRPTLSEHFDQILVAAGRKPCVEGMDLEKAGVDFDPKSGIHVDDRLKTTASHIFAAGDVASPYKFTHAADAMARIVVQNALFPFKARASRLVVPWCTYTDPELAHVGLTPQLAEERQIEIDTYELSFRDLDRALLDGECEGLARIHVRRGNGRVVGGTIVARHAGEMIGQITMAVSARRKLDVFSKTIQPYPTRAEALRKLGDDFRRSKLQPGVQALLRRYLAWLR